ncbi:MAG: 23S rRNA (adenine(2503)-C(2))-methyltransferase RlmN [Acholeplasmatales bacterium]|jgi:23S rRNA (adenine2503-C2)-methyltransferase|nr:23S rRNA (adenine(2503)-C(2))-methyltransferase RlmN [Acholeplasmatales bacterium]
MNNSIYNLSYEELENLLLSNGFKKYRASQIWEFLYKTKVSSFKEMANVGASLVEFLEKNYKMGVSVPILESTSSDTTKKILYELSDGNIIETVLINNKYGYSLCVSTQIGCNMGCTFCASTQVKKVRNLDTSEIIEQFMLSARLTGVIIKSVVFMGIGEPFDNYDNLIKSIKIFNHPKGLEIGIRHITVSTCGIIPKIIEFSKENMQVNLAISLHASNNDLRTRLMPITKLYSIKKLIEALKIYYSATSRRITIEYIMLDKVNDSIENAKELSALLKGLNVYINLIPYNSVENVKLACSKLESRQAFFDYLTKEGFDVTLRRSQGSSINAACGQLRVNNLNQNE